MAVEVLLLDERVCSFYGAGWSMVEKGLVWLVQWFSRVSLFDLSEFVDAVHVRSSSCDGWDFSRPGLGMLASLLFGFIFLVGVVCLIGGCVQRVDWGDPWGVTCFAVVYEFVLVSFSAVLRIMVDDLGLISEDVVSFVWPGWLLVLTVLAFLVMSLPIVLVLLAGRVGGLLVERSAKKKERV